MSAQVAAAAVAGGGGAAVDMAEQIAEYNELLVGLRDAEDLQKTSEADDEVAQIIADIREQLLAIAQALNASETITVTPGLVTKTVAGKDGAADQTFIALDDDGVTGAPYEVLFDQETWYSCVITAVVPPGESASRYINGSSDESQHEPSYRQRYAAYILGYHHTEVVTSELLRPFSTERVEDFSSGLQCAAVHPRDGRFRKAQIDRLTLNHTVWIDFANHEGSVAAAAAAELVELPLSHVRAGRFYPELRKKRELTEEEKANRRAQTLQRKRERREARKQITADVVAQNANDWQKMITDLGMGGGGVAARKRRRL